MRLLDKAILTMAAPVFAGHLLSFLYGIADTVFVSMIDRNSTAFVSGIGLTLPLNLLALALGTGLMAGGVSLVARAAGAGDAGTLARAGKASLYLGLACSVMMGIAFVLGSDRLISLLAAPSVGEATKAAARSYLSWVAPGYAVLALELAMLGPLLGIGKTVVYGKAMAIGTILNMALDPLFIFTFGLGVAGAAMATSLATVLAAAYIAVELRKEADRFGLGQVSVANDGKMKDVRAAREIARVGLPQALSLLIVSLSFMTLNRIIAGFGETRLNAWILVGRFEECIFMIGYAIGNACMVMAGTFWGAGNREELLGLIGRCMRTALTICALVIIPYALLSPILFRTFTGNTEVISACAAQVRAISWATAGVVVSLIAVSGLQGMGKALSSLALIVARLGIFLILPVLALRASGLLGFGTFLAVFAASSVLGGALSVHVFRNMARGLPSISAVGISSSP